jgi:hypothetical protein
MQLDTKAQIAKLTLSTLTVVVSLFLLGVLVLVLCVGFEINPFRETTSSFLLSAFAGLIGVATVLVLLNVATNISLIADAKIAEIKIEPRRGVFRKWLAAFFITAAILVAVIFAGTYFSKRRYLSIVRAQADAVLNDNKGLLEEESTRLASGKPADFQRICAINDFLANQRSNLPELTVIYSQKFGDRLALYEVGQYFDGDIEKGIYAPTHYACTEGRDCDYLTRFFTGSDVGTLQKCVWREDQFFIYVPYVGKGARFVALFGKRNRYGKIGS